MIPPEVVKFCDRVAPWKVPSKLTSPTSYSAAFMPPKGHAVMIGKPTPGEPLGVVPWVQLLKLPCSKLPLVSRLLALANPVEAITRASNARLSKLRLFMQILRGQM